MKRTHPQSPSANNEVDAYKAIKLDGKQTSEEQIPEPILKEFNDIQNELGNLDVECAKEQMSIQKKFDEKKKPWFEKRQNLINKIPSFWCKIFQRHPAFSYLTIYDFEILKYLNEVDLDDNIDDNGSYKITFVFGEEAKQYFEPLTLTKNVKFDMDREYVEDYTEIQWKPGQNPIEKAMAHQKGDSEYEFWSIFQWFTKQVDDPLSEDRIDIGEIIRRDIWHDPFSHYLGTAEDFCQEYNEDEIDDEYEDEEDVNLEEGASDDN